MRILGKIGALMLALACSTPACFADPDTDAGLSYYRRGDFKQAAIYFARTLRTNPANPKALYYAAMCCRKLNNPTAAQNGLTTVVQIFPNTQEAQWAAQELKAMGVRVPGGKAVAAPKSGSQPVSASAPRSAPSTTQAASQSTAGNRYAQQSAGASAWSARSQGRAPAEPD